MEGLMFDTCFLIDLERERRRQEAGPVQLFLQKHRNQKAFLSAVALGELSEGFDNPNHEFLLEMGAAFALVAIDMETAFIYGRMTRMLRNSGNLIGTNDLWIAASALRHGLALVTANQTHFGRISGLSLLTYRG